MLSMAHVYGATVPDELAERIEAVAPPGCTKTFILRQALALWAATKEVEAEGRRRPLPLVAQTPRRRVSAEAR